MYICVGYLSLCACVWVHDIREFLRTIYHLVTISKYHNIEILDFIKYRGIFHYMYM